MSPADEYSGFISLNGVGFADFRIDSRGVWPQEN
jgi:hypothetical protein